MRSILLILFFLLRWAFAQTSGPVWYFGNQAGLDFSSGTPVPFYQKNHLFYGASTVQLDKNGNLLFYTNGSDSAADRRTNSLIYNGISNSKGSYSGFFNSDHILMSNSDSISLVATSLTPCYVIKSSKSDSLYFIFHGYNGLTLLK